MYPRDAIDEKIVALLHIADSEHDDGDAEMRIV